MSDDRGIGGDTYVRDELTARQSTGPTVSGVGHPHRIDAVAVRHRGRYVVGAVIVIILAWLVESLARNPNIDWGAFREFVFYGPILAGVGTTIELSLISMVFTIVLGVVVAACEMSGNPLVRVMAQGYVAVFRAAPLIVLILVWGNFALLFPRLGLSIPFTSVTLVGVDTNAVLTLPVASVIALSIHSSAYMAEIVRAAVVSVDAGQTAAALAIGLTRRQTLRYVILPQATRAMVPPTGNQFIMLLKYTSLVSVIGGGDLLTVAENVAAANYKTMELLFVATAWYLLLVVIASIGQALLERRMGRSRADASVLMS